jgi:hypothetical protein
MVLLEFFFDFRLLAALWHWGCLSLKQKWIKVNVKESRNRPGVAQRFPGGLGSQIS